MEREIKITEITVSSNQKIKHSEVQSTFHHQSKLEVTNINRRFTYKTKHELFFK